MNLKHKKALLLMNLGTPDAPTPSALRRYLREFLSDPRVVEIPRLIWFFILNLFILPFRPARSAKLYQKIWLDDGSPLLVYSQQQQQLLQQQFDQRQDNISVFLAMRYGNPSIKSVIRDIQSKDFDELIVLPLYPQYSCSTTASTFDAVTRELKSYRKIPQLKFISNYFQEPIYTDALVEKIEHSFDTNGTPEKLIISFHGTPEFYRTKGDPYYDQCIETSRLVTQKIHFPEQNILITFQSRFGKTPWLQPYTDVTIEELAQQGIKNIAVICPGFSCDCLETMEEINISLREQFLSLGGEEFHYIPALNDSSAHIDMMVEIVNNI